MSLNSIIVPVFNEEKNIIKFYNSFLSVAKQMKNEYELIFVDDGSIDSSLQIIKNIVKTDDKVKFLSFSRNFGKEAAMFAGLEKASGDYVAIVDCDGQDPIELLPKMEELILTGNYGCIATRRKDRKGEQKIRSFFSSTFYKVFNKISKIKLETGVRDYRIMTKQMVNAIIELKEFNRFSKGLFCWVGFKTKYLEFDNVKRIEGTSKWSLYKLFLYSFEAITSFSDIPLFISSLFGILFLFISLLIAGIYIFKTLFFGEIVKGFPTLICSIFLIGGIQLFCIGILGQYLAKLYTETKKRPIYIVKEMNL